MGRHLLREGSYAAPSACPEGLSYDPHTIISSPVQTVLNGARAEMGASAIERQESVAGL